MPRGQIRKEQPYNRPLQREEKEREILGPLSKKLAFMRQAPGYCSIDIYVGLDLSMSPVKLPAPSQRGSGV